MCVSLSLLFVVLVVALHSRVPVSLVLLFRGRVAVAWCRGAPGGRLVRARRACADHYCGVLAFLCTTVLWLRQVLGMVR